MKLTKHLCYPAQAALQSMPHIPSCLAPCVALSLRSCCRNITRPLAGPLPGEAILHSQEGSCGEGRGRTAGEVRASAFR